MAPTQVKPGQIITFYSYKGGTGRSMAVANFACWLVKKFPGLSRGVLVMDWDLEAPGLHRYFAETAERAEHLERPGIINYFDAIRNRLNDDPQLCERLDDEDGWSILGDAFPLDPYLVRNVVGGVDLVKAGHYDAGYAELISRFNWVEFYSNYGAVFPAFRDLLLRSYDFCLIDSRTGLNDVSGICTMLLPERLVTVFTPNRQNVSGVLDLAGRAADYRLGSSDPRTLSIFPLPSRIENAEHELMLDWQKQYQQDFELKFRSIYKLDACDLTDYFDDVQLPHVSFYSYGEEIALRREERSGALSLSRAYESFFEKLVGLKFAWEKLEPALVSAPVEADRAKQASDVVPTGYVEQKASIDGRQDYASNIYISYAHLDNVPLLPGQQGWVETFHRVLEARLGQLLGEHTTVWRDAKLQGNDVFLGDSIEHRLGQTHVFVAIITPRYIKSEWCLRELMEFYRQAEKGDGVVVGGHSRIIKVQKTPVDLEPSELQRLLPNTTGYQFYELDDNRRPREFALEGSSGDRRFWERLDDVAYDIAELLKKQQRGSEGLKPAVAGLARSAVYLAETSHDLESLRDSLLREFLQRGYEVLPRASLPRDAAAFREAVVACLEQCRFAVHLVGDNYGLIPDGEGRSAVDIQNELAAAHSAATGFSRVIWMPVGLRPHDQRQALFVERLRFDTAAQRGADLLESSLEGLKTLVQRKLERAPGDAPAAISDALIRIYVIADARDASRVRPLEDWLFGLGFEVIVATFEGDAAEIMQLHKENLLLCDAALIYYGHGSHLWLHSKLTDLRKAMGWGRARPMLAQAVILGSPRTPEKERFRTHEAVVITDFGDFSPERLEPLVAAIRPGEGAHRQSKP